MAKARLHIKESLVDASRSLRSLLLLFFHGDPYTNPFDPS